MGRISGQERLATTSSQFGRGLQPQLLERFPRARYQGRASGFQGTPGERPQS
jgi:hypothetical protein